MIQGLIVGLLVAGAAAYAAWSLFLRGWLRKRAAAKAGGCGGDCNCGD
jgi:hypothetical protein